MVGGGADGGVGSGGADGADGVGSGQVIATNFNMVCLRSSGMFRWFPYAPSCVELPVLALVQALP